MGRMTDERIAESKRATERARVALGQGDRLYIAGCGDYRATVSFQGWDGDWITSYSGKDDISARHILKLNGVDVDFGDPAPLLLEHLTRYGWAVSLDGRTIIAGRRRYPYHEVNGLFRGNGVTNAKLAKLKARHS